MSLLSIAMSDMILLVIRLIYRLKASTYDFLGSAIQDSWRG